MRQRIFLLLVLAVAVVSGPAGATLYNTWDLEAVDDDGLGTHPLVGAAPSPENRVTVEGIALNTTGEMLDPLEDGMYSIFIQDQTGGLQVWAGKWWYGDLWVPPEYITVEAGDLVRVEGFIANHNGKVFINDRHSSAPEIRFTVTILEKGVGMPEPKLIPSVSACNYFDQTRAGGGEKYQTQWCRLNDVEVVSGTWGNYLTDAEGNVIKGDLTITDGTGELIMHLSRQGDFDDCSAPTGKFDVIGIFDQEDPAEDDNPPFQDHYRIWVKKYKYIIPRVEIRKTVKVQWTSAAGVTYQVYRSDDVTTWESVGDPVVGDGTAMFVLDDIEGAWKKFYRIEIQ
ncbi:hypothetical protein HQ563_08785 [bacterium]|nr:hypothetical protein [bacterium]